MQLFGGREAFAKKLDALFTAEPGVSNEEVSDMTGFIGQYVHGNEPSHHIAFLYIWAGQPWKTQERVREILLKHYRNDYDGLDGNEDCGQMSAWFFMSALGLVCSGPGERNVCAVGTTLRQSNCATGRRTRTEGGSAAEFARGSVHSGGNAEWAAAG